MKKLTYNGKDVKIVAFESIKDCFECIFRNCESDKNFNESKKFEKDNNLKSCVNNHTYIYA